MGFSSESLLKIKKYQAHSFIIFELFVKNGDVIDIRQTVQNWLRCEIFVLSVSFAFLLDTKKKKKILYSDLLYAVRCLNNII